MNAVEALRIEKKETHKRIRTLKKVVTIEQLQKQALDCEYELEVIKKGGKNNGTQRTQSENRETEEREES